jgi:hypothetical protein
MPITLDLDRERGTLLIDARPNAPRTIPVQLPEPEAEHLSPVEAGIRRRAKAQRENSFIYDSVEVATTDREDLLVMLDTERTMSAAWRKRAMEAEVTTPPEAVTLSGSSE